MLKHIKRDTQADENLMRISQETPPLLCFDLTNAMKLWAHHVLQGPAQSKCHHKYKKRQSKSNNNRDSLSTDDDDDDNDDEFEL